VSERGRDRRRKAEQRSAERDLYIPECANPPRRLAAEADDLVFLKTYFPRVFTEDWTPNRVDIVQKMRAAGRDRGDQAIAAERGGGKSSIVRGLAIKGVCTGEIPFLLIVAATGEDASEMLENIKEEFETNPLLLADYPEICIPAGDVGPAPQRARSQTVNGELTRIRWSGRSVIFPIVNSSLPGKRDEPAPSSGLVIQCRGADSAIRGVNVRGKRPTLIVIDDIETSKSAKSVEMTNARRHIIEHDLAGLGGRFGCGRLLIGTIQQPECLTEEYTNRETKPTWTGVRYKLLEKWPTGKGLELAQEYLQKVEDDNRRADKNARQAHQFYLENREEIERGTVVSSPQRFDDTILPDGSHREVSTVQYCYNWIARIGETAFRTEYNNDPPEELGPTVQQLTAYQIQYFRRNGHDIRVVPPGCTVLARGIDVSMTACHWVVMAFQPDATCHLIDEAIQEIHFKKQGTDEEQAAALDVGIYNALTEIHARRNQPEYQYRTVGDELRQVDLTLIDSRYMGASVFRFCRATGGQLFWPAMGWGESVGADRSTYRPPKKRSRRVVPFDGFHLTYDDTKAAWRVDMDTDRAKGFLVDRLLTNRGEPAAMYTYGPVVEPGAKRKDRLLFSISKHFTAERREWVIEPDKGRKWRWKHQGSSPNHYFDAAYMAIVASWMMGICLPGEKRYTVPIGDQPTKTLQEMADHAA
jgi:hypothetical protein